MAPDTAETNKNRYYLAFIWGLEKSFKEIMVYSMHHGSGYAVRRRHLKISLRAVCMCMHARESW